tara:strand:- start:5389 stop:6159 length:771 start_codon:yes stop_codon:yes gene_type:complete
MKKESKTNFTNDLNEASKLPETFLAKSIEDTNTDLEKLSSQDQVQWGCQQFDEKFVLTTSFGIQSAVLLHMTTKITSKTRPKVIWIDTGYLPKETYEYAEELTKLFKLDLIVTQSDLSPARMEALYGRLWETGEQKDLEKYHQIRKVEPLEKTFSNLNVVCWASGVRKNQTQNRKAMKSIDCIRERLTLRPLLNWSKKDIFYYMEKNNLPQHPLFEKGYSTVGDWHLSGAENNTGNGRSTRFGGLSEECGIHLNGN